MGYGVVDAGAAVQAAHATLSVDLYIRDHVADDGSMEPNNNLFYGYSYPVLTPFDSPDIWLENFNGTARYYLTDPDTDYKLCVRIHNRGSSPSTGKEKLYLNWSRNKLNNIWHSGWENSLVNYYNTSGSVLAGDIVESTNIIGVTIDAIIPAGGSYVKKVDWYTPFETDLTLCDLSYLQVTGTHAISDKFAILARIHDNRHIPYEYNAVPLSYTVSLKDFVCASNNVAVNMNTATARGFGTVANQAYAPTGVENETVQLSRFSVESVKSGFLIRAVDAPLGAVVQVYSVAGVQVAAQKLAGNLTFLPLPAGIYLAKITSGKGECEVVKVLAK
jgi:hypothetical protein